jgi:lipopolysaccharide transport protein LptA
MAALHPDRARVRAAAALLLCCAAGAAAAATPDLPRPSKDQPIDLVAASSDFDYKNNALLFKQVKIAQGPLKVEADAASATGLNFEESDWTLSGKVKITVPDGMLTSSDAKVMFRKNQISRAEISGAPAEFQQLVKETGKLAKGHANSIVYDVQANTVRMAGDAWLTDGENVIRGETLIYDIAGQRVAANPGGTDPGGVRITINPRSQDKPADKDKPAGTQKAAPAPPKPQTPQ